MACYSRALSRVSQFAYSTASCLKETSSNVGSSLKDAASCVSNSLMDCGGKVCKAAMSGIKKVDEWVGFIDPMAKTIKNIKEKDYVGAAREVVVAAQLYPKVATIYVGYNFAEAYANGGTYSSELAIPIVFVSCTLVTTQRMLDALEAHMLQKKLEVSEEDIGPEATAIGLQNLNPAKFTRLFFLEQNIRHLSELTDQGIEAVKNTTSLVLKHKFRFKTVALVGQLFMAYLSIRQGNHEAELMNKQVVILSTNGATLLVITGAKLLIEGIAAKKLKAAIMGNQQSAFLSDIATINSRTVLPESARASSFELDLLENRPDTRTTCSSGRSTDNSPFSLRDIERAYRTSSEESSGDSPPRLIDIEEAYHLHSDSSPSSEPSTSESA